jgi:hypothetical protein
VLADGTYDVFVVDATPQEEGERPASWVVELTVVTGEHKGEVLAINASGLPAAEFDLIGMPGTLTVTDGRPSFTVDR